MRQRQQQQQRQHKQQQRSRSGGGAGLASGLAHEQKRGDQRQETRGQPVKVQRQVEVQDAVSIQVVVQLAPGQRRGLEKGECVGGWVGWVGGWV